MSPGLTVATLTRWPHGFSRPQHAGDSARAWLLLFDLHKRRFRPRESMELHLPPPLASAGGVAASKRALEAAGLADMDEDLWEVGHAKDDFSGCKP